MIRFSLMVRLNFELIAAEVTAASPAPQEPQTDIKSLIDELCTDLKLTRLPDESDDGSRNSIISLFFLVFYSLPLFVELFHRIRAVVKLQLSPGAIDYMASYNPSTSSLQNIPLGFDTGGGACRASCSPVLIACT